MNKILTTLFSIVILTACAGATPNDAPLPPTPTADSVQPGASQPGILPPSPELLVDDFFSQNGITLTAPECEGLTQEQTEGPYYKANTPERTDLLEEGMQGTRLILVGYVLDQDCRPQPNARLDFWQADAAGAYDNNGYSLRGHQFSDSQGRYFLQTIFPGLYESRPIEHIHVKVRPESGVEVTTQLYFPGQPIEALTVMIEERGDHLVGYFNFVVQK